MSDVPIEELEHMAEVWRQRELELMRRDPNDKIIAQRASQLRICASGLEGLIEEHKND